MRRLILAVPLLLSARAALASCGAYTCPIDLGSHEQPRKGVARLDVSYQYIDQDQPRAGARRAAVGQVPNPEHDELDTINRVWTVRGDYDFASRWGVGFTQTLMNRTHDHVSVEDGSVEHWGFTGFGDLLLQGRYAALRGDEPGGPTLIVMGGVKLPTGLTSARNGAERADVALQPGSGSWDLVGGLTYSASAGRAPMLDGDWGKLPLFASFTYKENNPGTNRYRFGDELLVSAGGAYPLLRELELLGQANLRIRLRDYNGDTGEDTSFTGGETLYLSPGLRWRAGAFSPYAYVQLPVHQRVNREQLTSPYNVLAGVAWQLGGS